MTGRQIALDFGLPLTAATVVTGLLIWWVYSEKAALDDHLAQRAERIDADVRAAEMKCIEIDGVRTYNATGQYMGCNLP